MTQIIVNGNTKQLHFDDVITGDFFLHAGSWYVRIEQQRTNTGTYNAIRLTDFELYIFSGIESIQRIAEKVTID